MASALGGRRGTGGPDADPGATARSRGHGAPRSGGQPGQRAHVGRRRAYGPSAPRETGAGVTGSLLADVLQLCVMSDRKPDRVGVRELRQNLSVYVKRVRDEGRAYEVTERGEPVAHLTPLPGRPMSTYQRLLPGGEATP